MLSLSDLNFFCRLYFAQYRIEHEATLVEDSSLWGYELRITASAPEQLDLLERCFKNCDYDMNKAAGSFTVYAPIQPISQYPVLKTVFGRMEVLLPGLVGAHLELQVVIASVDLEYRGDLTRAQQWEWLVSADMLTELYAIGEVNAKGFQFGPIFHSCHQASMNRDITEDIPVIARQWQFYYSDVAVAVDSEASMDMDVVVEPTNNVPRTNPYRFKCPSAKELGDLMVMIEHLGLKERRGVSTITNDSLRSTLSLQELTDMLYFLRYGKAFEFFSTDMKR